jgi:hypothetical protein
MAAANSPFLDNGATVCGAEPMAGYADSCKAPINALNTLKR